MSESRVVQELCDRIAWIEALFAVRTASDEQAQSAASERLMETFPRVAAHDDTTRHQLLQSRLGLTETEMQVVWLLAAFAISSGIKSAILSQQLVSPALTIETLRRVVYGERPSVIGFRELAANGTLRRLAIIERNDGHPHEGEARWTWTLAPRVLAWLHGDERIDPAVAAVAGIADPVPMPDALVWPADAVAEARRAMQGTNATIVVAGKPSLGRRTMLVSLAAEQGSGTLCIDCARLHRDHAAFAGELRLLARECRLLGLVPILVNLDALAGEDVSDRRIELIDTQFASHITTNVLATSGAERPPIRWGRPIIVIEVDQPTSAQRALVWQHALGETDDEARELARMYPLAPGMIHRAATAALARTGGGRVDAANLSAGIRAVLDDQLGHLARRVAVSQTWDDLVLPVDQVESIVDLIARVRSNARVYEEWGFGRKVGKGLGVSAVFSGPPGTGKTMVAALIARDLGLELYQVDLAKVISKWIGESERNLAKLFDAAEAGCAVLLFDEADSLFGKRTEVKSSNDRYANLETNYLLQRLESFTGVCLLTTNHEANIDPAFQRRLSLHVRFELPEYEERARLWRSMLSTGAPVDPDVDVRQLARKYELSGGSIRNAALRAAFFAADKQCALTMPFLERAARLELEGMGKIAW
ncbi:MAG: ATP-binding protein [Kofleriaceae bacterium]